MKLFRKFIGLMLVMGLFGGLIVGCGGSRKTVNTGGGSVNPGSGETKVILAENFESYNNVVATTENFLTANYRAISDGKPMYGNTKSTNLRIVSGALEISGGSIFTIGDPTPTVETTSSDVRIGSLDLSGTVKISFKIVSVIPSGSKKMQVLVDNNTTSSSKSIHSEDSRIINVDASGLVAGNIVSAEVDFATATSFVAIRTESGVSVTIDDLLIELIDRGSGDDTGNGGDGGSGGDGGGSGYTDDPISVGEDPNALGWLGDPVVGFANGTTGGTGGMVSYVNSGAALQKAIYNQKSKFTGKPQIIYVCGVITEANTGAKQIDVKDVKNISIIGLQGAEFNGIGINIANASNIIVQNVTIHHNRIGQKDAISISRTCDHIWIDHCELYNDLDHHKDYYDELLSAKNSSELLTFSWNYLHDSYKTSLIGSSDSDTFDRKITYHHNRISNCNSRLPSYRGGTGHIYNNLYENSLSTCINSRVGAKLLVQNNYFYNCKNPIGTWFSNVVGYWFQEGNVFDQCYTTGSGDDDVDTDAGRIDFTEIANTCEKIELPYTPVLETAEQARLSVLAGAGVGKLIEPSIPAEVVFD